MAGLIYVNVCAVNKPHLLFVKGIRDFNCWVRLSPVGGSVRSRWAADETNGKRSIEYGPD